MTRERAVSLAGVTTAVTKAASSYAKLVVLLVGGAALCLVLVDRLASLSDASQIEIDPSWQMSLSYLLQQHQLLGRDSIFTYGPLSQVIAWLGTQLTLSGSALDGYATAMFALGAFSVVVLCTVLACLESLDWRRTFLILVGFGILEVQMWPYYRPLFLVLSTILLGIVISSSMRRQRLFGAAGIGILCFVGQLLAMDVGIYAFAAAVIVLSMLAASSRFWNVFGLRGLQPAIEYLAMLLCLALALVFCNVLLSIYYKLSSSEYLSLFDYQRLSIDIVRGYSYGEPIAWVLPFLPTMVLVVVILYTTWRVLLDIRQAMDRYAYILLGFLVAAGLQLKACLVRSDLGHIDLGFMPMCLLFLIVGVHQVGTGDSRLRIGWAFLLFCFVSTWPLASLGVPATLSRQLGDLSAVVRGSQEVTRQTFSIERIVPQSIWEASDPGKEMLSYPWDNYIPIALQRRILAPVVQAYVVMTESLQDKYIQVIDSRKASLEIVYGIDGIGTYVIDGVPQVTRAPRVFDYIYRNFEAKTTTVPPIGYVLLEPRSTPRSDMEYAELTYSTQRLPDQSLIFTLSQPASCSLIRLMSRIAYPITVLLGRANPLAATVSLEGAVVAASHMFAIETEKPFQTYLQLIPLPQFSEVLGDAVVPAPSWDELKISVVPMGFLETPPTSIEVSRIECVTFDRASAADLQLTVDDFVFDMSNTQLWTVRNMAPLLDGESQMWTVSDDPQLEYRSPLDVCLSDYTHLYLRMTVSADVGTPIQVFYLTDVADSFNGGQVITLAVEADGQEHAYSYALSRLAAPQGVRLKGMRLDPVAYGSSPTSQVHIQDLRLIRGNLATQCTTTSVP